MGTRFRHAFHFPIQKFDDEIGLYKNFRYLEDFIQQLAEQDGQGPTTILAPSDYAKPELANVVLNGRTDGAVINDLLLSDGWIHILPGTVKLETGLLTPSGSSAKINKITGSGWSTILKVTASIGSAIFFSFQQRLTIRDLVIDCDSKTSSAGLDWDSCIDLHADHIWIKNSSARGFRARSTETFSLVNCLASNNGTVGFDLAFDSDNQDARVIGCTARDNTGTGFVIAEGAADSGVLVGCVSTDNGGWGFDMDTNKTILNVGYVASGNTSGNVRSGGGSAHGIEEQVYVPGDHAAINLESLSTASTDVSTSLKPDGAGSAEFVDTTHADLASVGTDDHHAQAHTVASHSDTTATGAELETLTDTSDADSLHTHGAIQTTEEVQDIIGAMVSSNTETLIAVTYEDVDGTLDFVVAESSINHDALTNFVAAEHKLEAAIDHDALTNFVANEHLLVGAIDHDQLLNFLATEHVAEAVIDHGTIAGLADDDHSAYPAYNEWAAWSIDWTLGGTVVGNGTSTARFTQIGKLVECYVRLVFGSTTTQGTHIIFSLPVTASSSYSTANTFGTASLIEAGVDSYAGHVRFQSTTQADIEVYQVSGADIVNDPITSTKPHTWGTSDLIVARFTYEAATAV